jgi:hypothetical protein
MNEKLQAEYDRLTSERSALGAAVRAADGTATPEQTARHAAILVRLREIVAMPPDGYALPKAAALLTDWAASHGWQAMSQWGADSGDSPFVTVQVGRKVAEEDGRRGGPHWYYKLTWHNRDCEPGKLKKFGAGTAETPDNPRAHDAPSIHAIRAEIYEYPAPGTQTVFKGALSRSQFHAIPKARALRISYDWPFNSGRYTEWVGGSRRTGWHLMNDYGIPGNESIVSRADSRSEAAARFTERLAPNILFGGHNITIEEWEIAP